MKSIEIIIFNIRFVSLVINVFNSFYPNHSQVQFRRFVQLLSAGISAGWKYFQYGKYIVDRQAIQETAIQDTPQY